MKNSKTKITKARSGIQNDADEYCNNCRNIKDSRFYLKIRMMDRKRHVI